MGTRGPLIGREAERDRLESALERAALGEGSLVLLAGEAGVGKTRLAGELAASAEGVVLWGGARRGVGAPYAPIVDALRAHLRSEPRALAGCEPLRPHLALLLPELGDAAPATDRGTLTESVRCAVEHLAGDRHALIVLDDLQSSDEATLELLGALAQPLRRLPVVIVGAYRSDELPREHMLRRLRNELRRESLFDEVTLDPLTREESARLLADALGEEPAPALARAVHDRTQGVPFFVEELGRALVASDSLSSGEGGLELADDREVPLPDTVRDAVRLSASELTEPARTAAEAAAAAGESFDLALLDGLAAEEGVAELVERGFLVETDSGMAQFRHSLACEAIYADIPWIRRRSLHRRLAEAIEESGGASGELATHWLGAREEARAREALLRAVDEFAAVHAYRDAAAAGRQAIELWPEGDDPAGRLDALERYASCAELAGELPEAARAWREIVDVCHSRGEGPALAEAERRLAGIYELQGERERAFAAREVAAAAFAAQGAPAEAAVERLAMANHLRYRAEHTAAAELAQEAGRGALEADRPDLRARALGLEGMTRAKAGDFEAGLRIVRSGLALALERDMTAVAADLYQFHSVALYDGADYVRAEEALDSALELCRVTGSADTEVACVSCMAYVLRERGEWGRSVELSRELIDAGAATFVAEGVLGAINLARGKLDSARRLLSSANATATKLGHYGMIADSGASLAALAAAQGDAGEAAGHCESLLRRWERSDDHHYAVPGLRWGAAFFARRGDSSAARACAEALAKIASDSGHAHPLAGLAHALAEAALHDGDIDVAAEQLERALELHRGLEIPYERAQIELRAGVALAAAGRREPALERLSDAYRTARKLGARPLAAEAAGEVTTLGESVERRLGRRAAADAEPGGLSRRELEVVRMVAVGHTNKEVAAELFVSPRTVDMHVRNILRKLECRSRVEAAHRARELGLLD